MCQVDPWELLPSKQALPAIQLRASRVVAVLAGDYQVDVGGLAADRSGLHPAWLIWSRIT